MNELSGLSQAFAETIGENEEPNFRADASDRHIVATDQRLLVQEELGVTAIDYGDIRSIKSTRNSKKGKKFWAGVILLVFSIPGILQGSTGTLFLILPAALLLLFLWYRDSKIVEIEIMGRPAPFQLSFDDNDSAAAELNRIRRSFYADPDAAGS